MALKSKSKDDDEDDGESPFMPLDEVLRKLKAGPLNFGVYQTPDKDNPVLIAAHKRKNPTTLGKKAKKEAGTIKGAYGRLSLDSEELVFLCENDDPPAGLKKRIRVMLKNAGYAKFKPRILLPGGAEMGDEDEEDANAVDEIVADGGGAEAGGGDADVDARKEAAHKALIARAVDLENEIYHSNLDATYPALLKGLQSARGAAHDERFAEAAELLAKVTAVLARIKAAAAPGADRKQEGSGAGGKGAESAAGTDAALQAEVVAKWAETGPVLASLADAGAPAISGQASKLIKLMQTTLEAGDYKKARGALVVIDRFIANALRDIGSGPDGGGTGGATPAPAGPKPPPAPQGGSSSSSSAPPPKGTPPAKDPPGGAPPVTADENARLAALPPEELAKTDLTVGDTKALFSEDYMMKLKDAPIKGEGDPKLKDLMSEIEKKGVSGPRRLKVMQDLSRIVGVPPTAEKLDVDYGRFLVVREQQKAKGKAKGKEDVPPLDEKKHPDFCGSRSQLMFGKVLGDAFGIHEVFAALLSPTGGLVGPDNSSVQLDPDNPVALHGTVHDAAGYLQSYHDEGPGYNYRDEPIEDVIGKVWAPLGGQLSGVQYWVEKAGADYAMKRIGAAVVEVEKQLKPIRKAVEAEIDRGLAEAKNAAKKIEQAARKLEAEAEKKADEIEKAIRDAPAKLEKSAVETLQKGTAALGKVADEAKKSLEAAWDFIWD